MSCGREQFEPLDTEEESCGVRNGKKSMMMLDPTSYYSQGSHAWQLPLVKEMLD